MAAKLIILRHGEKPKGKGSALQLSRIGKQRALALAAIFLGKGATRSLFDKNGPDAFFAITSHTVETASPSAESWRLPVIAFCTTAGAAAKNAALDVRTAQAAEKVRHALKRGKTVVMVWEHKRIAGATKPQTTLRELLNLGRLTAVPDKWPDDDFDTMWIFACDKNGRPAKFQPVPQHFHPKPKRKKRKPKGRPKKRQP
jgi:hypothetical protein